MRGMAWVIHQVAIQATSPATIQGACAMPPGGGAMRTAPNSSGPAMRPIVRLFTLAAPL
ncbi:hypothetical protein [Novosphingobium decolorationis]|uniref:Uncharacterized protein n=1 Tax=Novosphingobium decolorationis TaxID=2698673 RepID=A0ABX8DZI6_9SPHN|nr:hypothetical protein HT578_08005 [Novosphingobium decolorationis]